MLGRLLKKRVAADSVKRAVEPGTSKALSASPRVLNVGGGSKAIAIPEHYTGWEHLLLDIDPRGDPDVLCDARELDSLDPDQFDAIYCSHNLEHYYKHDVLCVLQGFLHVLKPDGFAEIRVPDMTSVLRAFVEKGMDIEDILYVSSGGPISVRDVIYGWGLQIERTGDDFYAHKTGFTAASLQAAIASAGFHAATVTVDSSAFEIRAVAFKTVPTAAQRALLKIALGTS